MCSDWCPYLKAQAKNITYNHKPALSEEVQEIVKPMFEKLTRKELLTRCLGKNTQNKNECYNKTSWSIAPKHTFVGKEITELAVQISLSLFNEGRMTILKTLELMGCTLGLNSYNYCMDKDNERISKANKVTKAVTKESRLARKKDQLQDEEALDELGNLLYGPGIAD